MREEKSKHKILIVDDEKSNLDILRRLFRRKYQVLSAESGEDALDILAEHEVALILSDQRMPGITGATLLERAMQTHPDAIREHRIRAIAPFLMARFRGFQNVVRQA